MTKSRRPVLPAVRRARDRIQRLRRRGVRRPSTARTGFSTTCAQPVLLQARRLHPRRRHGATFQDSAGTWWHIVDDRDRREEQLRTPDRHLARGFRRRRGVYCDTAYGDYPTYLPGTGGDKPDANRPAAGAGGFTGWMLLNYNKPVTVSSTLGGFAANFAVDEDLRTYWSASTGDAGRVDPERPRGGEHHPGGPDQLRRPGRRADGQSPGAVPPVQASGVTGRARRGR